MNKMSAMLKMSLSFFTIWFMDRISGYAKGIGTTCQARGLAPSAHPQLAIYFFLNRASCLA